MRQKVLLAVYGVEKKADKPPKTVQITVHVHSSKEDSWARAEEAGIHDQELLKRAMYLGYEHKLLYDFDTETGEGKLVSVDGRKLQ